MNVTTTVLFRPVGPTELALIKQSGYRAFPPRLPERSIFYPVLNEAYARQITKNWNVTASGAGYVTRFSVRTEFVNRIRFTPLAILYIRNFGFRRTIWPSS